MGILREIFSKPIESEGRRGDVLLTDGDKWGSIHAAELKRDGVPITESGKAKPEAGLQEYLELAREDAARAKRQFPRAWRFVHEKGMM